MCKTPYILINLIGKHIFNATLKNKKNQRIVLEFRNRKCFASESYYYFKMT